MGNVISCRAGVFPTLDVAFAKFPEAGLRHAEVPPPADGNYSALATKACSAGVTIATIATHLTVNTDETAKAFYPVIDGAASIQVAKIFVSVQAAAEVPREAAIARLQQTAEYAASRGVTICMETHPAFGTNGSVARSTLEAVNRPGLRFNFDTANIYYYNQGTDSVTELRKVAEFVASVHLKDTDGGFHSGNFPQLGTGVVDFPTVFRLLGETGFTGPYTLELEGGIISKLDLAGRVDFLKQCMDYLRRIGAA